MRFARGRPRPSWRARVVLLGVVTVSLVGAAERLFGGDASLLAFYVLPVSVVAWRTGRAAGLAVAACAGAAWTAAHASQGVVPDDLLAWNALNRLLIFALNVGAEVGVSVGVALFDNCPPDTNAALAVADRAMYEAKRAGKGRVFVITEAGDPVSV